MTQKPLISAILIFLLSSLASPANADSPILPDCFPHTANAKGMSVGAIYLHGWLLPNSSPDRGGYRNLERNNRAYLEAVAIKYNVRIAAPVGTLGKLGYVHWDELDLQSIEARARAACGGASLTEGRVLIGFSNGGTKAGRICAEASEYSKVLVLGPVGRPPACKRAITQSAHHPFPYAEIPKVLSSLRPPSSASAARPQYVEEASAAPELARDPQSSGKAKTNSSSPAPAH